MKPTISAKRASGLRVVLILVLAAGFLFPSRAAGGGPSGLGVDLYVKKVGSSPVLKYTLGAEEIPLYILIKNESKWPINADQGFSQVEADKYLVVTDPRGKKHTPPIRETVSPDMPPPFKWGKWESVPAEVLPTGWERTVIIDDLQKIFPMMGIEAGWYTIEAEIPFTRYGWTVETSQGLMGVLDSKAWHGTIKSKKISLFVAPARGAQLRVRVEDLSTPENPFVSQVPVRIFRKGEIPTGYSLDSVWPSFKPLAEGTTNPQGWVSIPCLPEPASGDAYLAIARYKNLYSEATFEPGGENWKPDCGGKLEGYIFFGKPPHKFSVFGLNSVWIRNKARIESGNAGAQSASSGPWLVPNFELSIAENAWLADGYEIRADSVQIRSTASVYEVYCNNLESGGTVRLDKGVHYGLTFDVWPGLEKLFPLDKEFTSNKDNILVGSSQPRDLPSGTYGNVTLQSNSTLRLTGGVYKILNLTLGSDSRVICQGATTVLIGQRLYPGTKAYLGPATGSNLNLRAKDFVIYVKGANGKTATLGDSPKAAQIGEGCTFKANIYAKNGTLLIQEGCVLEGSFIAKDVEVGMKTVVNFDSAW